MSGRPPPSTDDAPGRPPSTVAGLLHLLDALPVFVAYVDGDGRNRYANASAEQWFGRSPDQLVGLSVVEILGEDGFDLVAHHVDGALAGEPQQFERTMVQADGHVAHTQTEYVPRFDDGRPDGFYVLVTDITRRVLAEASHQASLVQAVLLEERTRMAAQMNDTVLQQLFALGLDLEQLHRSPEQAAALAERSILSIQDAIAQLRTAVQSLAQGRGVGTPSGAVRRMVHDLCSRLGLVVDFRSTGDVDRLGEEVTHHVVVAAGELLGAVARTRGTVGTAVEVELFVLPHDVTVRVTPEGPGGASVRRVPR